MTEKDMKAAPQWPARVDMSVRGRNVADMAEPDDSRRHVADLLSSIVNAVNVDYLKMTDVQFSSFSMPSHGTWAARRTMSTASSSANRTRRQALSPFTG